MPGKHSSAAHLPGGWDQRLIRVACDAARHHAARFARQRRLSRADQEDLAQDILLAIVEASPRFDPERGAWSTFVAVLARRAVIDRARRPAPPECLSLSTPEGERLAASAAAGDDTGRGVEFALALAALPDEPRALLDDVLRHADLAAARDAGGASPATFYRRLGELRCWLRVLGLGSTTSAPDARGAPRPREKEIAPIRR